MIGYLFINQPKIVEAKGKLGVLLVGMGAVSTTTIAGVLAIRRGLAKPIGSLTQMGTVPRKGRGSSQSRTSFARQPGRRGVRRLGHLRGQRLRGREDRRSDRHGAAQCDQAGARSHHADVRRLRPQVRQAAEGPNVKRGANKREMADQLRDDIRRFKEANQLDWLVLIWCGSTEVYLTVSE